MLCIPQINISILFSFSSKQKKNATESYVGWLAKKTCSDI
jgi:hypothetical protein